MPCAHPAQPSNPLQNPSQVVEISPEFLLLGASEVSDIISSDRLAVDSEEEVLTAVLKWASHVSCFPRPTPPAFTLNRVEARAGYYYYYYYY
jgi:hypothetical protein